MKLDATAKERVRAALEAEASRAAERVASFEDALELHQFALAYNVNDGVLPIQAVVEHPRCDAGTALRTFWEYGELIGDDEAQDAMAIRGANWDVRSLLAAIEKRFEKGYATSEFFFDPAPHVGMFPGGADELRGYGVCEQCLHAIGKVKVSAEPLS